MAADETWAGRKVMITGGLGFLGSNLARRLVGLEARVLLVDAMVPGFGGNFFNVTDIIDNVTINYCDTRDHYSMQCLVKEQEVLFHLAGSFNYLKATNDPWSDMEINCRGTLSLLEACRKKNPEVKIVYGGNRAQYGKTESIPVKEEQVCRPLHINAVNCMAAENYLLLYHKLHQLRTTSLRLTSAYGPRHQMRHFEQGIINWFVRLIMENRVVPIFGDGEQIRDITYADDVVDAFLLAAAGDKSDGRVYNLGGEKMPLIEIVKLMVELTGKGGYRLTEYPDQFKIYEVGNYAADYGKITRELGWKPKIFLREGLSETFEFYTRYGKHYW